MFPIRVGVTDVSFWFDAICSTVLAEGSSVDCLAALPEREPPDCMHSFW